MVGGDWNEVMVWTLGLKLPGVVELISGGVTPLHSHPGGGSPLSAWPVGSVFATTSAVDPATLLGGGTWVPFAAGRVLVGLQPSDPDFDVVGEVGGAKAVALAVNEMPTHTHVQTPHSHILTSRTSGAGVASSYEHGALDVTSTEAEAVKPTAAATAVNLATGGGAAHQNMPPYVVVYMWERVA